MSMTFASRRYFASRLRRDALAIATRPRVPSTNIHKVIRSAILSRSFSDRRLFHPVAAARPLKSIFGSPVRAVPFVKPKAFIPSRSRNFRNSYLRSRSQFVGGYQLPAMAAVCVRRKIRREVIFATGRSGGGRKKPPRFNYTSAYRC